MRTSTIITIIVILAVVGGFVLYQNQSSETPDQTATTTADTPAIPDGWSEYEDDGLSFSHPSSADISKEAGRIKIQILGDDNEPNTEVTDGITAYISTTTLEANLQTTADRLFAERSEMSQEVIAEVTSSTFANKSGFSFQLRNQLGSVTDYHILSAPGNQAYIISYTASGSDSDSYVDTFETIIGSLEYDEDAETGEAGTSTANDNDETDTDSLAQACQQAGGNWLAEHDECEGVQENWCTQRDGSYNNCASACRHDPDADFCTQQCVFVCSF